ncbi:uncharacterized protein LOC125261872 isoform X2 [Megalobrama amblycephala]|uniref:uncharacterized protein LOC125261872 isoform X2 n=1 Tax=Megalobrama amblycephala TaxID=75352 RepID=UPI0020145DAA|nr:uncharacterized protein LOC125261872 isoform X2 [Megalobrama amblycephala]
MNAVNTVQLFIVVWTFTAVCRADDDGCSCEDVTGTEKKEVTLICNVSLKRSECCIILYKFYYTEKYKDSTICREDLPLDSCEQRNNFTCRHTPTTAMIGQFRFFVQTMCGVIKTKFTVNITEMDPGSEVGSRCNGTIIVSVVGCFIILILIIIIIIDKNKSNQTLWIPEEDVSVPQT